MSLVFRLLGVNLGSLELLIFSFMTNYTRFSYPVVLILPYRFYETVPPIFLEVSHLLIALRCWVYFYGLVTADLNFIKPHLNVLDHRASVRLESIHIGMGCIIVQRVLRGCQGAFTGFVQYVVQDPDVTCSPEFVFGQNCCKFSAQLKNFDIFNIQHIIASYGLSTFFALNSCIFPSTEKSLWVHNFGHVR